MSPLSERQEHLLVWLWECNGLSDWEVETLGEPGDGDRLNALADMGLIRISDTGWERGVFS